jgi:DNA-binding transcriptional regulator of glucitol operon
MLILVAGCLGLGWWQIGRAAGGNALSFGYAVEWPVFALFVIFMWYREVQMVLRGPAAPAEPMRQPLHPPETVQLPARPATPEPSTEDDPELAAYNDMLAWLAEDPSRRPSDYNATVSGAAYRSGAPGAGRVAGH